MQGQVQDLVLGQETPMGEKATRRRDLERTTTHGERKARRRRHWYQEKRLPSVGRRTPASVSLAFPLRRPLSVENPRARCWIHAEGQFRTQSPEQVNLQEWNRTVANEGSRSRERTPQTVTGELDRRRLRRTHEGRGCSPRREYQGQQGVSAD